MNRPLAIITGGTKGIGEAAAFELAGSFDLALIYHSDEAGATEAVAKIKLKDSDSRILAYKSDITKHSEIKVTYDKIKKNFGCSPQVLINSAGKSSPCLAMMEAMQSFRDMIEVNYLGAVNLTKLVVKDMCKNNFGRVINISSSSAADALAGHAAYSSSKVALEKFGAILGGEVAKYGVTVNSVRSGLVATKMTENWLESFDKNSKEYISILGPSGKLIERESVAKAIAYLVNAPQTNCSIFTVDGGYSEFKS